LLDFGLSLRFGNRLTEPGYALGTLAYMAPEQAFDSHDVDIRADIFGLGGTLFWCLTGRTPFSGESEPAETLIERLTQPPPSARKQRPSVPAELDAVVARMMAPQREERYATPQAVMRALLPFLELERESQLLPCQPLETEAPPPPARLAQVLIVDDESGDRSLCRYALGPQAFDYGEAANGLLALEALKTKKYDLVLLDLDMPEMTGQEVLSRLRQSAPCPHLKVIMLSGRATADEMAQLMVAGADD
jgi:putative two-component system response regulator